MGKLKILIIGIIIGLATLAGWRFLTYQTNSVHYHANFAVFINGERQQFSEDTYYQEFASCSIGESTNPVERAHMHDHVNDLVHVHASAVTWGQFFENLGWSIGQTHLQTRLQLLLNNSASTITYILNGEKINNLAGLVIGNEDRLLISYGASTEKDLTEQLSSVSDSAKVENTRADPASCGGQVKTGWRERWYNVVW